MIESQKEVGWEFIFLGANIDAAETAVSMGIDRNRSADYISDPKGTNLNYNVLSGVISSVRSGFGIAPDWHKKIDDDIKKRKR
jgi:hypothetical protein